eukprot:6532249-Pyramimonas_sp.AAC.1
MATSGHLGAAPLPGSKCGTPNMATHSFKVKLRALGKGAGAIGSPAKKRRVASSPAKRPAAADR